MATHEQNFAAPKRIGELINPYVRGRSAARRSNSECAELVGWFADKLNDYRKGTKWKPLTYRAVAVKLADACPKLQDLYYLKSLCLDAEKRGAPFSAVFWSELKPRK
jgi:hypothetical protein